MSPDYLWLLTKFVGIYEYCTNIDTLVFLVVRMLDTLIYSCCQQKMGKENRSTASHIACENSFC